MPIDFEDAQDMLVAESLERVLRGAMRARRREEELRLQEAQARHERHWRTRLSKWLHRVADSVGSEP